MNLSASGNTEPFHKTVDYVDLERFSGDWYVIALIPTAFEKGASHGIENYSIDSEGNIRVRYTFTKGSENPKEKVMYQKGWVYDFETNAEWRVQPLWPLKLPYYVLELAEDYSYTVIGTNNYKYLWIMARSPVMETGVLEGIINRMTERGFDRKDIIEMEQKESAE
ncbi:lipocalin family protein [Spirochaeta isovalerica]|uniref:Apolipoprotein D and lipocalin family protein n=1 Tax=Spirochaeta isovalerica TaxID=150 RepID=A0A841RBW5_9SPIO|nr:lipocalin family protein [Spirochaeta isovalerica]MBB6481433.1 apolipoprotein D and lipocalin family protein [Spirochaeta isovalerica]